MKVLVCGSRTFSDADLLRCVLDGLHRRYEFDTLIHGAAKGADSLAADWGRHQVAVETFPADWRAHGKAAGPIRNRQMLNEGKPDLVVAFIDKRLLDSVGTNHMVEIARTAGVRTVVVEGRT